ncbi:MAG: high-potential iron-sulfur protein [Gammaproteobacteria bacterium]|nr:high-potential iron-sulfur protein [Gammaproteobacteria bacterium]
MTFDPKHIARRHFVTLTLAGVAASQLPLGAREASAAELPPLSPDDTTAKALGYTPDASTVSVETRGGADHMCMHCRFFTPIDEATGSCSLFPGRSVAGKGWCRSWVAKA